MTPTDWQKLQIAYELLTEAEPGSVVKSKTWIVCVAESGDVHISIKSKQIEAPTTPLRIEQKVDETSERAQSLIAGGTGLVGGQQPLGAETPHPGRSLRRAESRHAGAPSS